MEQQKTKESKKRYFAYDLMRAAAMLLIVFYHMNCEWSARLMDSSLVVTKIGVQGYLGWQGVSLFILVSGAAQCISYERCSDLKTYYKKRWWSIFPSFYMAYFVCYLMGGFGGGVKLFDLSFLWLCIVVWYSKPLPCRRMVYRNDSCPLHRLSGIVCTG